MRPNGPAAGRSVRGAVVQIGPDYLLILDAKAPGLAPGAFLLSGYLRIFLLDTFPCRPDRTRYVSRYTVNPSGLEEAMEETRGQTTSRRA